MPLNMHCQHHIMILEQPPSASGIIEHPQNCQQLLQLQGLHGLTPEGRADACSAHPMCAFGNATAHPMASAVFLDQPDQGCWLCGPTSD